MTPRVRPGLVLALLPGLAAGCRSGDPGRSGEGREALSVLAASSLTEAFQDLERGFEEAYPEVDVQLTFAGSQVLRLQIEQGAAVDVFASANQAHMEALALGGLVSHVRTFAYNELVAVVPADNPAKIRSFADLARARRIVLGTENVPVGMYAREVLRRAGTELGKDFVSAFQSHVVSEESNARLVRAKVELGEADAALVYRTDAVSSERILVVDIPAPFNVRARYPMGRAYHSPSPLAAEQFVAYVLSEEGRQVLDRHGFLTEVS